MKKVIYTAAAGAAMFVVSGSVHASELIFGFNDPTINGFAVTYDGTDSATTSVSESTSAGVTEGTGALDVHLGMSGGYNQNDVGPSSFSADLIDPATNSLSLNVETTYADANYITLQPVFQINGTNPGTAGATDVFAKFALANAPTLSPSATFPGAATGPATLTYSLLYKDPFATAHAANTGSGIAGNNADGDTTTGTYTVGHILAAYEAANPSATVAINVFDFEFTSSGTAAGVDVNLDNVTIPSLPSVPEPASLGVLTLGGLAMLRRRLRV